MTVLEFTPAVRTAIPLLLGVAGGTGSGKTYSAFRLAKGISGGEPFHVIDTENGRALHYADDFDFLHARLDAPYRPSRYAEAIDKAEAAGARVIVVDSASHSWTGAGGVLEWHDELEGGDARKKMLAWQKPKADHRVFENALLHTKAHVILAFRAAPKVEMRVVDGQTKVVPKERIAGGSLDGWIPESDPRLPYELTLSFLLMADRPGFPKPIKLEERHRPLVPLDSPLSEETGAALAAWARGDSSPGAPSAGDNPPAGVSPATPPASAGDTLDGLTQLSARLIESRAITVTQIAAALADMRNEQAPEHPRLVPLLSSLTPEEADALFARLSEFSARLVPT